MAQENYVEGCSMKRPPFLEPNGFCFWKARFDTYVKSKYIDLWQVIQNGDFYFEVEDSLQRPTTLKSLDSDYSSKNHVRKFLCALPLKWRAKVTTIEEAKYLTILPFDELIGNLKVYETILGSDGVVSKPIKERIMPIALKANISRAFVGSEDGDEPRNDATCLMAIDSQEDITLVDDDMIEEQAVQNHDKPQNSNYDLEENIPRVENIREIRDHPIDQVIGELDERTLRSHTQDRSNFFAFVSTIEPKNIKESIKDESWTMAMQEELGQFVRNDVCDLVPCPIAIEPKNIKEAIKDKSWIMAMQEELDQFEDPKDTGVHVLVYANSDHAGDVVDRKSTSGICTFVGSCSTSWFSKKQTSRTNSITKSDCVAAERACQQALWMKQAFVDYNITIDEVLILCDDKCAINLTSSPIDYPRTKHIEIRHHFLKDNVAKKHITIYKISLGENVANILTKLLEKDQFSYLRQGLGLMLQEEEEERKCQDVIEEWKSLIQKDLIMFEFILKGFTEIEIWNKVKEPLSPKLNEDEYSICCENTTHMMNALKKARMESRDILLSIHHSLKMLLDNISKMNRKLEDEKVKMNDKGKEKVKDF
ncbi:hypothetical protein Tco_0757431 [Tanacetum coccineum]